MPDVKDEVKIRKRPEDKTLDQQNKEMYKKKNEISDEQIVKEIQYPAGTKMKIIKETKYRNGVVKRKLVGLSKENKLRIDRGVDKKIKQDLKLKNYKEPEPKEE